MKKQEQKEWEIKLYKTETGECPMQDFISSLSEKSKKKLHGAIDYLKERGTELHRPQSALLRDGIRELRVQLQGRNTRTLYFFVFNDYIILTHAFTKNEQKVPDKEIDRALAYKEDFLQRFNKTNIQEA